MHARTRRQREVLEIITRYVGNQGYNPSYQQIAKHLGLKSRSGIARIIAELESQGLLERKRDNGHFAISTQGDEKPVLIPWLESPGSEAFDPAAAHPIALPTFMIGACDGDALRALRMPDSTMSPVIEADDIVLIELREFTREGRSWSRSSTKRKRSCAGTTVPGRTSSSLMRANESCRPRRKRSIS